MWDKMETPAVVYDLDTSGGLMEQIQTLLAPPKSEDGEKRSRRPDKDSRRSGRATNHDTCDSCREGGDLLCCDYCPAAFHLQCCNPPLSEEMLPPGDWMCHRCVVRGKKRDLKKDQINGLPERALSKRPSSPATELELGVVRLDGAAGVGTGARAAVAQVRLLERRAGSRPGTPTSNASSDTATPSEQNEEADEDLLDAEEEAPGSEPEGATPRLRRPFELLIAAAMERNPTQFQLPSDLTCTTALPGTSKRRRKEETTGKNVKKPQHELDHNGLVPLPVKVCFSCGRSCRLAPLIQCDYCPLLFHMDCLDPPLTALPTGRWMCPNHIEHVALNQKSMTLSNRCQLFDQFQDRLSQHAIKVDFLQRVHRQNLPNRRGAHQHGRKKLKVPDAVKAQYRVPPALMAPAGIRSGELICNGIPEAPSQRPTSPQHLTSETEQQEWLRSVIALQCSVIRHFSAKQTSSTFWDSERTEEADVKPCVTTEDHNTLSPTASPAPCPDPRPAPVSPQGAPVLKEVRGRCSSCVEVPCPNCGTANGPLGPPAEANGTLDCRQSELQHRLGGTPPVPAHTGVAAVKTEDATLTPCAQTGASPFPADAGLLAQPFRAPLGTAGGQAAALTSRCVSSPAAGTRAVTPPRATKDTAMARMGSPTPPSEIEMSKLDEKFIQLLAWQRIQQLFPPKVASPPSSCVGIPAPNTAPPRPQAPHTEANRSEVQARAVFYPLTGKAGAVNMCYRTLYIGTGADMDVCLKNYGHCNYVSGKHACIFYDENTKHYELLNYSEHGTTVDNVLYSCDFSEKSSPGPSSSLVSKVQNIIRHCKKRKQEEGEDGPAAVMSCQSRGGPRTICSCKASSSSLIGGSGAGWEGTALLHHGSYIKMGCLQFVFSVTEFALRQPKEHALKLHQASVLRSNSVP